MMAMRCWSAITLGYDPVDAIDEIVMHFTRPLAALPALEGLAVAC